MTERDPGLLHQVVLTNTRGSTGHPDVNCNCRIRRHKRPMGKAPDFEKTKALFNEPSNHEDPFDVTWMLGRKSDG